MKSEFLRRLTEDTEQLRTEGLFKPERVLTSPQQAVVRVSDGSEVINLCANNYLGLANHASVREAARLALDRYGYGMSVEQLHRRRALAAVTQFAELRILDVFAVTIGEAEIHTWTRRVIEFTWRRIIAEVIATVVSEP